MGTLRLTRDGVVLAALPVERAESGLIVPPGGDLSAAYAQVPAGGTILLQTGLYGEWDTPSSSKLVTVKAFPGATPRLKRLHVNGNNMTFDGLRLDAGGTQTQGAVFETGGFANITFRNGFIGNVHNEKGALIGGNVEPTPLNILIENVRFDNITFSAGTHSEAIYGQAPGLTVRNCYFGTQCGATGAIFLTRGDWWGQKPYGGWVFEGNTFERQQADHGGIIWADPSGASVVDSAVIRGNDFKHVSAMPQTAAPKTFINSVESCNKLNGQPVTVNLTGITHQPCA